LPLKKVPVNPHRLDAARIIRLGAVHQIADGINFQRLIQRKIHRQLMRFTARVIVFQSPFKMIRSDEYRHPVVQRRNGRIRSPRDDGE
jgi:hypothetical protein